MSITIEVAGPAAYSPDLSPSEKICLLMIAEGRPLSDIGVSLGLPDLAVEHLLSDTEKKLGAHNRLHAISLAMLRGHLDYE
jgi:DNA-binding CsgD family transcriptional regulator